MLFRWTAQSGFRWPRQLLLWQECRTPPQESRFAVLGGSHDGHGQQCCGGQIVSKDFEKAGDRKRRAYSRSLQVREPCLLFSKTENLWSREVDRFALDVKYIRNESLFWLHLMQQLTAHCPIKKNLTFLCACNAFHKTDSKLFFLKKVSCPPKKQTKPWMHWFWTKRIIHSNTDKVQIITDDVVYKFFTPFLL